MKMERPTAHRTGTASWMPPANFGELCRLVAFIVTSHGHNFKGEQGQTHNGRAPTLLRSRYKSKGWPPSCVRTCHKPRPPTEPSLAFHTTVVMFSSYPRDTATSQDREGLPPLQHTTHPINNAFIHGVPTQPTGMEEATQEYGFGNCLAGLEQDYSVSLDQPTLRSRPTMIMIRSTLISQTASGPAELHSDFPEHFPQPVTAGSNFGLHGEPEPSGDPLERRIGARTLPTMRVFPLSERPRLEFILCYRHSSGQRCQLTSFHPWTL
ncbi:hypothetical protein F5888DRAFT_848744 [Russula emetica]|nr:hypothetical protein F5888DRAFT_848744 [Russula emetica]